jgi:hypothetical protein
MIDILPLQLIFIFLTAIFVIFFIVSIIVLFRWRKFADHLTATSILDQGRHKDVMERLNEIDAFIRQLAFDNEADASDIKHILGDMYTSIAILEDRNGRPSEDKPKRPYNRKTKAIEHKKDQ